MKKKFYSLYPTEIKYNENGLVYEDRTIMRAQQLLTKNMLQNLIQLNLILEYDNKLKVTKIVIFLLYLISWIYILIISVHSLNIYDLLLVLNMTWLNILEPFSSTDLM